MKDVGENARSAAVISSPSVLCGMAVMPYRTWSYGVTILIFDWMPMRVLCRPER
jgi:hypothetical protein